MCGIAGIYSWRGGVSREALTAAAAALAHRGPDGRGAFCEGPVGLVHARLSIIDLAQGGQPLSGQDGNAVLVANGEIYNYVELRQRFEAENYRFATHSDCETALAAYCAHGDAFLSHLEGMFALALYDRATQRLILARDRLGIKPLFVAQTEAGLYFGSELKALFALLDHRPRVAAEGLAQFMQFGYVSGRTTLARGIERLAPGEAVCIGPTGIERRWRYWTPAQAQPQAMQFEEAVETFDALMRQVMREHLRSDVPFGLFLSGGVDSACLLALMAREVTEPLRTYSVGFAASRVHNELEAASTIAARFGTRHTVLELTQQQLLHSLPHAVWAADELMADYANLPVALLSQRAAQDLKVVLSGEGGDEVFAGYAAYRAPRLKRWLKNLRYPGSGGFRTSKPVKDVWARRLYRPALQHAAGRWRDAVIEAWRATPAHWNDLARMQATDIATWLPDDLLVKADRMMMAWGLEGRVPFLDHRVVEFGLSLPPELKIEGKTGKVFLRRWAERYLPRDHLWARKRGFTVPVAEWLRQPDVLARLERSLPQQAGVAEWFEPAGVRALIHRQASQGDMTMPLWRLWQFALWHRLFVQGAGQRPAVQADPLAFIEH